MRRQLSSFLVLLLSFIASFGLAGCSPGQMPLAPTPPTQPPSPTGRMPSTPTLPTGSTVPTGRTASAPTPTTLPPSPTAEQFAICFPLEGLALEDLAGAVVNPFHPPRPGSDDPHQGVDLAVRQTGSGIALAGTPVQAVLPGRVAAVIQDRFPYGNALIVETPLETLPELWLENRPIPTSAPTPHDHSALTCPTPPPPVWDASHRSLYLLYAHMQAAPAFSGSQEIHCGQVLGQTGSTGNALNPHLHLEARLGPANARFSSLAHYDSSATLEEMSNYCQWRVSGFFQLVDPMVLLKP